MLTEALLRVKRCSAEIYVFSYARKASEAFTFDAEGFRHSADVGDITKLTDCEVSSRVARYDNPCNLIILISNQLEIPCSCESSLSFGADSGGWRLSEAARRKTRCRI